MLFFIRFPKKVVHFYYFWIQSCLAETWLQHTYVFIEMRGSSLCQSKTIVYIEYWRDLTNFKTIYMNTSNITPFIYISLIFLRAYKETDMFLCVCVRIILFDWTYECYYLRQHALFNTAYHIEHNCCMRECQFALCWLNNNRYNVCGLLYPISVREKKDIWKSE